MLQPGSRISARRTPLVVAVLMMICGAWAGCAGTSNGADGGQAATGRPLPEKFAIEFDGINDYASTGTAGFPKALQAQTLSLWVNRLPEGGFEQQTFVVLRRFLTAGVHLGVRAGRLSAWRTSDGAVLVEGPLLPEGTWHHIAYVFDGAQSALFLDGGAVASSAANALDTRMPIGAWLGTFDGTQQMFKGQMDAVRIWGTARTAAELTAEALGQLPNDPLPPELLAWWGFDEEGGATAADYSGNRNLAILGDGDPTRMPKRIEHRGSPPFMPRD